ncbi:hypothetical protein DV736_g5258, partial [Chaetothyriales sp. CBS 134916]
MSVAAVEVPVPAEVGELHLLDRIDYEDAWAVDTTITQSPEQWIRAFAEDAPRWFQLPWLSVAKVMFGAQFGPLFTSLDHVVGWRVLENRPDLFTIGLDSSGGLSARVVALTPPGQAMIATQIDLSTVYARTLWSLIRPGHRYFVPYLLARAATSGPRRTDHADPRQSQKP